MTGLAGAWRWLEERPRRGLILAFGFVLAFRLPFLFTALQSDEGGFLYVARQWGPRGPSLYGDLWVDRPPFLLLVFNLADTLGGDHWVRVLGVFFALVSVAAAWLLGRLVSGSRGAVGSALITALLGSNFSIDGYALTGEGVAVALVLSSMALTIYARYESHDRRLAIAAAFAAGFLASTAFLTKQSFLEAGIFAGVLLGVHLRRTWRLAVAGSIGLLTPLLVTAVWAQTDEGPGLIRMWHALYRFRTRSNEVIHNQSMTAPLHRLHWLIIFFITTGMVLAVWQAVAAAIRYRRSRPELGLAGLVTLGYGVFAIAFGASWWSHYLLQLVPVCALGTAFAAVHQRSLRPRVITTIVAACAIFAGVDGGWRFITEGEPGHQEIAVGDWLKAASEPGDSVVLAYGSPNVIERSGLSTPYRYIWSLPVRARDAKLKLMVSTLEGSDAPTWLVEIGDFNWWQLDTPAFQAVRKEKYHVVANVCGHDVYLHDGLTREVSQPVKCD